MTGNFLLVHQMRKPRPREETDQAIVTQPVSGGRAETRLWRTVFQAREPVACWVALAESLPSLSLFLIYKMKGLH